MISTKAAAATLELKDAVHSQKSSPIDSLQQVQGKHQIIDWDGENDPENPRNWSYRRKWLVTAIVSGFSVISQIASTMLAPVSGQLAEQFDISSSVILAMCTSLFVLAYAFGPLFFGPMSEIYGRSRVVQVGNFVFVIFNMACGFAQNTSQLLVFRALSGFGGSAPFAIGGGIIGDAWHPEERGAALAIYTLAPVMGPVIAPVLGAWISLKTTWKWVIWSILIVDGIIAAIGIIFMEETYSPVILQRKLNRMRREQLKTDPGLDTSLWATPYTNADRRLSSVLSRALTRPIQFFFGEPIIQLLGIYQAFVYGLVYLVITTIPDIYQNRYGEPIGIAGLHYIALGIGLMAAIVINGRYLDRLYTHYKHKNNDVGKPEFRLPLMFLGSLLLPAGLFLFGWTAQNRVLWPVPDVGLILIGAGINISFQVVQVYVIDAFTHHAASALAAVSILRTLCGFGFPLFAPVMYDKLGFGVGNSILAGCAVLFGVPSPYFFWKYGERLRTKSKHAHAVNV